MAYTERYVNDSSTGSGDGTTEATTGANAAWTWAQMLTSLSSGQRANVKGNVSVSASNTFSNNGTASSPMAIRGYSSSASDLIDGGRDNSGTGALTNTSSYPVYSNSVSGGDCLTLPTHCDVSCMYFKKTGSSSSGSVLLLGTYDVVYDCVIEDAGTGTNSPAVIEAINDYPVIENCDIIANASNDIADAALDLDSGLVANLRLTNPASCTCPAIRMDDISSVDDSQILDFDVAIETGTTNSLLAAHNVSARNCDTFFDCKDSTGTAKMILIDCVAWGTNAVGSEFYKATTTTPVFFKNCCEGNFADADQNVGDWLDVNRVSLTADPFTSSSDLRLNATAGGGAACQGQGIFGADCGCIRTGNVEL